MKEILVKVLRVALSIVTGWVIGRVIGKCILAIIKR